MTINLASIANLARPGLSAVFGDYEQYPSMWSDIYEVYESDKNFEQEVEMRMLGLGQIVAEGAPMPVDNMGQRSISTYFHRYVKLSFQITRQAVMDNLYKTKFPMMAKSLKKSLAQTKEVLGAAVLNNGFNAAFPIGDGQPFFSTAHPIDGNTQSNTLNPTADLSEAALESALIQIQQFRDVAGLISMNKPLKMIVPPQNQYVAERILGSEFRTQTANNDRSAVYNLTSIPEGYRVNQFLTIPTSWFILTDAPNGMKHFVREPIETDVYCDFSTQNLMASASERYSFGVSNWRAMFGVFGV